jgi:hypothetical protein
MSSNTRYDSVRLRAEMTPEGYLRDSPIVARSGVQIYRRADGSTRREYRPADVVFEPGAMSALAGIPIIDTHVGMMSAANVRQHAIGTVLSSGRKDGETMVADIVIHDPTPVTKHNRKELSLCYNVRCDENSGTTPEGEPYDAMVTAVTSYNHLALVERGRAGIARLRLDSDDSSVSADIENLVIIDSEDDTDMSGTNTQPAAPAGSSRPMISVRIDGIEYPAAPEIERHLARLNSDMTVANKRADTAEAERDTLKQAVASHDAKLAQARSDTAGQVRARIALESVAKEQGVDVRADDTDRAIRENIIRKVNGAASARFDDKSDDYVVALYDGALERSAKDKRQNVENRMAVAGMTGASALGVVNRADALPSSQGGSRIASAAAARATMIGRRTL